MRSAATILVTGIVAAALYSWRAFTFAIWVNAALISHAHPLLTVSAIEGTMLLLIGLVVWGAASSLLRKGE